MSFTMMRGDKGWTKVPPSRRFHFYDENSKSLCGKSVLLGVPDDAFTPADGTDTPDKGDCAGCWEKLNHRPVEPPS